MGAAGSKGVGPVVLVWGDDEFSVKERARGLFASWGAEGGAEQEIVDAAVGNSGEALRAIGRLREALQTLPFFGTGKVVWFRDCSFLADDRTGGSQAVTGALAELAAELKGFRWEQVRLLISATKVDKRKTFYKTLEKLGEVEAYAGLTTEDRDWAVQAEGVAARRLRAVGKTIDDEALALFVSWVGPNTRQIHSEVEKLALYVGDRERVGQADVEAVTTRQKQARAFALGDALADRDLPRLLRCLDEELWAMRQDPQKSEIGLLYGLISKVRSLVFAKALVEEGLLRPERDYSRFKAAWERLPTEQFAEDKRCSPLAVNPYVMFRAVGQSANFTAGELAAAMETLLRCNLQLVSSRQEGAMILQRALVEIAGTGDAGAARRRVA